MYIAWVKLARDAICLIDATLSYRIDTMNYASRRIQLLIPFNQPFHPPSPSSRLEFGEFWVTDTVPCTPFFLSSLPDDRVSECIYVCTITLGYASWRLVALDQIMRFRLLLP